MAKIVNTSQANAGDPVEATLDKNELKLITKVANDPVFSQESNWGLVSCIFKHKDSSRRFVAAFKASEIEVMNLKPSMLAGDNFEIKKIIIAKPNREMLVIKKSEIPSYEDYDFTLKSEGSLLVQTLDFTTGSVPLNNITGVPPILTGNSAKFEQNCNIIINEVVYESNTNYKARIHIKDLYVPEGYLGPIFYLQNLYGSTPAVILEIKYNNSFEYQEYNPDLDMNLHKGGYIEYSFQSNNYDPYGNNWFGIVVQNFSFSGTFIDISKIEIFKV